MLDPEIRSILLRDAARRQDVLDRIVRRCQTNDIGCFIYRGKKWLTWPTIKVGRSALGVRQILWLSTGQQLHIGYRLASTCGELACCRPSHVVQVKVPQLVRTKSPNYRGACYENATKTVCKHGHEFTEANTMRRPNGQRRCRACQIRRHREIVKKRSELRRQRRLAKEGDAMKCTRCDGPVCFERARRGTASQREKAGLCYECWRAKRKSAPSIGTRMDEGAAMLSDDYGEFDEDVKFGDND